MGLRQAAAMVFTAAALSGCVIGVDRPQTFANDQGFEHRNSSVGTSGFLSDVRNIGAPARSAEFMVTLRDGTDVVWVGRAEVADVDTGEDVRGVSYVGDRPLPSGAFSIDWRVVNVQR